MGLLLWNVHCYDFVYRYYYQMRIDVLVNKKHTNLSDALLENNILPLVILTIDERKKVRFKEDQSSDRTMVGESSWCCDNQQASIYLRSLWGGDRAEKAQSTHAPGLQSALPYVYDVYLFLILKVRRSLARRESFSGANWIWRKWRWTQRNSEKMFQPLNILRLRSIFNNVRY